MNHQDEDQTETVSKFISRKSPAARRWSTALGNFVTSHLRTLKRIRVTSKSMMKCRLRTDTCGSCTSPRTTLRKAALPSQCWLSFPALRNMQQYLGAFLVVTMSKRSAISIRWVGFRDVEHPRVHRTIPQERELSCPKHRQSIEGRSCINVGVCTLDPTLLPLSSDETTLPKLVFTTVLFLNILSYVYVSLIAL